jgi:hypothetical protein
MAQAPKTRILTGSPEHFAATRERGSRAAERPLDRLRAAAGAPA